jgi:hypothetical protein
MNWGTNKPLCHCVSAWLYASLSVMTISLMGLFGVAMVPLVQRNFYQQLLHFLVALAVGTMCGDALLHLLPHVSLLLYQRSYVIPICCFIYPLRYSGLALLHVKCTGYCDVAHRGSSYNQYPLTHLQVVFPVQIWHLLFCVTIPLFVLYYALHITELLNTQQSEYLHQCDKLPCSLSCSSFILMPWIPCIFVQLSLHPNQMHFTI